MYQNRTRASPPVFNSQLLSQAKPLGPSFSVPNLQKNTAIPLLAQTSNVIGRNLLKSSLHMRAPAAVIKGDSRFETVPFERLYIEQMEVKKVDYVPVQRKVLDYYTIERQTEYIPQSRFERYVDYRPVVTTEYETLKKTEYVPQQRVEYLPKTRTDYVQKQRVEEKVDYIPVKRSIVHPNQTNNVQVPLNVPQPSTKNSYLAPNLSFQQPPRAFSFPQRPFFFPYNNQPVALPQAQVIPQIPVGKYQRSSEVEKKQAPTIIEHELPVTMVESVEQITIQKHEEVVRMAPAEQPVKEEKWVEEKFESLPRAVAPVELNSEIMNQAQEEEEVYIDPALNIVDASKNIAVQQNLEYQPVTFEENTLKKSEIVEKIVVESPPQIKVIESVPGTLTHVETVHVGEKIVDGRLQTCPCEQCWKKQYYDEAEANRPKNKTLGGIKVLPDFLPPRRVTKL